MKKLIFFVFISIFLISSGVAANAAPPSQEALINRLLTEIEALKQSNLTLKNQVESLDKKQSKFELQLSSKSEEEVSPMDDLEKELNDAIFEKTSDSKDVKRAAQSSLGNSGKTNPDMGITGLISYTTANRNEEKGGTSSTNTFQFDEAEFVVSGYVDPYHKYDLVLGFSEDGVAVEEAYLSKFDLPAGIYGRIGKFRSAMGFFNQHHVDELSWAWEHILTDSYLGETGLTTTGLEVEKTFAPKGKWTPTLSLELGSGNDYDKTAGTGENGLNFWSDRTYAQNRINILRLRNHFDLTKSSDLSLSFSYLMADHGDLDIFGTDFQYRKTLTAQKNFSINGEYFKRRDDAFNDKRRAINLANKSPEGYMINVDYQFDSNWKLGTVYSEFDATHRLQSGNAKSALGYLAYLQTEFTRYLLQFEERDLPGMPKDQRLTLQILFSTGYHSHKLK